MRRMIAIVAAILLAWVLAGSPAYHASHVPTMAQWDATHHPILGAP